MKKQAKAVLALAAAAMLGRKALNLSAFSVKKIDGEWLIVKERTMHPCDYIRAVCTGDKSFTHLEM